MNKQALIIIIFIGITAFAAWQYFLPSFNEALDLRQALQTWQAKLNDTQSLSKKLEELNKKYENIAEPAGRVAQAVPQKEDIPGLLVQLEALSSQNGLILDSVTFSSPGDKKDKKTQISNEEVKILTADLNLSGSQNSLMNFLKAMEANLRIMDVAAISFGAPETGAASGQNFGVSLNVYYR